jgi:hypothetical protein
MELPGDLNQESDRRLTSSTISSGTFTVIDRLSHFSQWVYEWSKQSAFRQQKQLDFAGSPHIKHLVIGLIISSHTPT